MRGSIAALALVALMWTVSWPTQAEPTVRDALMGQWHFDASRSTFDGAMPYRSGKYTFTRTSEGVRVVAEIVEANGQLMRFEYLDREDGRFVPVSGNPFYDSQSTTWGDNRTAVRTEQRQGVITGTTTFSVAADGRSYAARASRKLPDGRLYTSVIYWNRAPAPPASR
jgi:hypothetical protein